MSKPRVHHLILGEARLLAAQMRDKLPRGSPAADYWPWVVEELCRMVEAEREACAKVAEGFVSEVYFDGLRTLGGGHSGEGNMSKTDRQKHVADVIGGADREDRAAFRMALIRAVGRIARDYHDKSEVLSALHKVQAAIDACYFAPPDPEATP